MNRKFESKLCWFGFLICAGFVFIFLQGCTEPDSSEIYYQTNVKSRDLQQIQTLELQKKETEETSPMEVNAPAPEKIELTLEECRAIALENNLDLKIQLINPAIAAERISQQEARFESAFNSNVSYYNTNSPPASYSDYISGSKGEGTNANLGVQVPLHTGGTVAFDLADNKRDSDAVGLVYNYTSNMSTSISQPLLRNAGNRVNTYAIRIAEYDYKIANARTKLEAIRVITDIDKYYWRLYAARKELEVRKQWYDHAAALLEQAERLYQAGQVGQVEVIRAQAGVSQRLEAIITSENNVRLRERDLKKALNKVGLEMSTPTTLELATDLDPVRYALQSDKLINIAINERMEMLELELQIAQDIINQGYLKNQALPLVTLDYTYNVRGAGFSRSDSYDLLLDTMHKTHNLSLNLSVPLGNGAAKSQIQQAFLQRRQRLITKENREELIEYEVLNVIDQIEANWQRILAGRQSSILYGRLSEAESRQFELGYVTSTDVLEAQNNLADAQSAEILALVDYQISLVDLAYATGTVFGSAKIRWEPFNQDDM
ncbi:MAG: TolC family protein [Sedimentisphaerales bacterium]|nr:TolC family protein [Sedimentisphaerales bacterium]